MSAPRGRPSTPSTWESTPASEDTGESYLHDDLIHSWFIDPALRLRGRGPRAATNQDPLFLNSVGSWEDRPDAATAIPNLFLAADYVRTDRDAATMESANEAGRAAVNALLASSGSRAAAMPIHRVYRPRELEGAKRIDAERYRRGQPHVLETSFVPRYSGV